VWFLVCLTGLSAYGLPGGSTPSPYGLPASPHAAAAAAAAAAHQQLLANSLYAAPHPGTHHDLAHHMSWSVICTTYVSRSAAAAAAAAAECLFSQETD